VATSQSGQKQFSPFPLYSKYKMFGLDEIQPKFIQTVISVTFSQRPAIIT
jgi:hypothetical protein